MSTERKLFPSQIEDRIPSVFSAPLEEELAKVRVTQTDLAQRGLNPEPLRPDQELFLKELTSKVEEALGSLVTVSQRDKQIFWKYVTEKKTDEELAVEYNLSTERIKQIGRRVVRRLAQSPRLKPYKEQVEYWWQSGLEGVDRDRLGINKPIE